VLEAEELPARVTGLNAGLQERAVERGEREMCGGSLREGARSLHAHLTEVNEDDLAAARRRQGREAERWRGGREEKVRVT
jgi:hypothetical protein